MNWITTKYAKFIEEEMVAVQYLPSDYSRTNAELIISLKGGAQLKFTGDEANELWERFGYKNEETE
jgi:hypothetical protein